MKKMLKRIVFSISMVLFLPLIMAALSQSGVPLVLPTIAAMEALGAASALYPTVYVTGYASLGDGGQGSFVWNSGSTATVDNGTIFQASGVVTGRWLRQISNATISTSMFGIVADSSGVPGNGTDWSTRLASLIATACATANGYTILIANTAGKYIRFATAQNILGCPGNKFVGLGWNNSRLFYDNASGYAFYWQNPNGTANVPTPQFENFMLVTNGGAIQGNTIAGGFTDDGTTQEPLANFRMSGMYIQAYNFHTLGQIAVQLSKQGQTQSISQDNIIQGFCTPLDLEGVDNFSSVSNYYNGACVQHILLHTQNTFGNNFLSSHDHFVSLGDAGSPDAPIVSNYRSQKIDAPYVEASVVSTAALVDYTSTGAGQGVTINGGGPVTNVVSGTNCFIKVSDDGVTGTIGYWINNTSNLINSGTTGVGSCFNSSTPGTSKMKYFEEGSNGTRRIVAHTGNGDGDFGIPFNSLKLAAGNLGMPAKVEQRYTPDLDGLEVAEQGASVEVDHNDAFIITPGTTTTNRVFFGGQNSPNQNGTYDISVHVYRPGATPGTTIACTVTDNNVPGAWPVAQTVFGDASWLTFATAITTTTSAGIVCYSSTSNVGLLEADLVDH